MPRVLLLATTTGYQTRAFDEAASRLGVELVFATDRCDVLDDPWQDRAVPIRFHDETRSVAAILEASAIAPLDGVVVVGDRPAVIAARVAQSLGLPGHPADAAAIAGDKERMRACLRDARIPGVVVPWFVSTTIDRDPRSLAASIEYPCVVKPVALSGSRGVMRADNADEFVAAFERLRGLLRSPDVRAERREAHERVLVEEFIAGRECAVEGLLHHGTLGVLALFDKPDPLDGPFFEETIYLTPSRFPAAEQRAIGDAVAAAARAIGLWHGPIHAECRIQGAGVCVLEVAARPIGGLCAKALRFERLAGDGSRSDEIGDGSRLGDADSRPRPYEELLLRHALGESPVGWQREADASGVMMIPIPRRGVLRSVDHVERARSIPNIEDVRITAKIDQLLVPLPEGASYLGFIFAKAATPGEVDEALRRAHAQLQFKIDAELPVVKRATALQSHHG